MSPFVQKEQQRLKQKQDNLDKARWLVKQFPNNPTIRIAFTEGFEIEIPMSNLTTNERIKRIYETLNGYIS